MEKIEQTTASKALPAIIDKYMQAVKPQDNDAPRLVLRRFHGREVQLWLGKVHIDDIAGYVDNLRIKFYLNRWLKQQESHNKKPTTDDIYDIMIKADQEEQRDSAKPFQIERIANSILRNDIREPLIIYFTGKKTAELWDGNRRFYGLKHIMRADPKMYDEAQRRLQWVPVYVFVSTGNKQEDQLVKHDILVECNFVNPEQIPWPNYVKAEEIHHAYHNRMGDNFQDPALSRQAKEQLAKEYGLKGWRQADRWIKMFDLALQFKEYEEVERERDETDIDLFVQSRFEYFDELSKAGVYGILREDLNARDMVFDWLWDGKFQAWPDVRQVPKILADPVALKQANEPDVDAVRTAIVTVLSNDPVRAKDKTAANEKISQFASWLDSFKREEYKMVNAEALDSLQRIVIDVSKIIKALAMEGESSTDNPDTIVEQL